MPRRLNKREFDDAVYSCWMNYMAHYGMKQGKKVLFTAYKELRRQENERKKVKDGNKRRR